MTRFGFGTNMTTSEFANTLIYKLQRKRRLESNDQLNADNTSIEDASTSLQLLVIWGSSNKHRICVRALLIKNGDTITWNENTLEKLHSMYLVLLWDGHDIKDTWLLDDATVLMTASKRKDIGFATEIIISEGAREDDSMEPLWFY
jgi:hypothetical protein